MVRQNLHHTSRHRFDLIVVNKYMNIVSFLKTPVVWNIWMLFWRILFGSSFVQAKHRAAACSDLAQHVAATLGLKKLKARTLMGMPGWVRAASLQTDNDHSLGQPQHVLPKPCLCGTWSCSESFTQKFCIPSRHEKPQKRLPTTCGVRQKAARAGWWLPWGSKIDLGSTESSQNKSHFPDHLDERMTPHPVMNMLFMMEFRNSRKFPLRLFRLTRSWSQNLQFKLTTHNSSLANLWNATSLA